MMCPLIRLIPASLISFSQCANVRSSLVAILSFDPMVGSPPPIIFDSTRVSDACPVSELSSEDVQGCSCGDQFHVGRRHEHRVRVFLCKNFSVFCNDACAYQGLRKCRVCSDCAQGRSDVVGLTAVLLCRSVEPGQCCEYN